MAVRDQSTYDRIREAAITVLNKRGPALTSREAVMLEAGVAPGSFIYFMDQPFGEFLADLIAEGHGRVRPERLDRRRRLPPLVRKAHTIRTVMAMAEEIPLNSITLTAVEKATGTSRCRLLQLFGGLHSLRAAVLERAHAEEKTAILEKL